ncbi:hypothetical protein JCM3766R1_001712 [Sporobolomyces carnicolor]
MARYSVSTLLAFALSASFAHAASEVGSPNLFECSPAAIQYTCDKPPCQIIARPQNDAATSLENFGAVNDQTGTVSWKPVNQKAGTVVVLYITNADGEQATSAPLTINSPNDDSNTLGADGKCSASASSSDSSSSSSSSATSTDSSASSSSSASGAKDPASSAVDSITSKAGDATSKAGSITSSAGNAAETKADSGSGASGLFVQSSALVGAAIAVVASAFY